MSSLRSRSGGRWTLATWSRKYRVFPEPLLRDQAVQILVGRRDDSNVQGDPSSAAQRIDLLALDDPKDLRLRIGAHVTDFVKKNRSAIGELKLARIA